MSLVAKLLNVSSFALIASARLGANQTVINALVTVLVDQEEGFVTLSANGAIALGTTDSAVDAAALEGVVARLAGGAFVEGVAGLAAGRAQVAVHLVGRQRESRLALGAGAQIGDH